MTHEWTRRVYQITWLMTVLSAVTTNRCTHQAVSECMAPLKDNEYDLSTAVVPFMNSSVLSDHCRRYELTSNCLVDITPDCTLTDRLVYQGIEDAYQFLCEDGYDEYLEFHQKCFANQDLHREGRRCNNSLSTSLDALSITNHDNNYKLDRICQYVKTYLDCVENLVESFCGEEAATWQRTLDEKSLIPLLQGFSCDLDGSSGSTHWVFITVGVLLTLSIIIIIVSLSMLILKKKKRRPAANNSVRVPDAPPPYEGPYVVYNSAQGGASSASAQAGPLPQKNPNLMHPPPYQPPSPDTTDSPPVAAGGDAGVAAGYFGVSPTSPEYQEVDLRTGEGARTADGGNLGFSNPNFKAEEP